MLGRGGRICSFLDLVDLEQKKDFVDLEQNGSKEKDQV